MIEKKSTSDILVYYVENNEISILQYTFAKYYLRSVVHILSEDLITYISTTDNLHT